MGRFILHRLLVLRRHLVFVVRQPLLKREGQALRMSRNRCCGLWNHSSGSLHRNYTVAIRHRFGGPSQRLPGVTDRRSLRRSFLPLSTAVGWAPYTRDHEWRNKRWVSARSHWLQCIRQCPHLDGIGFKWEFIIAPNHYYIFCVPLNRGNLARGKLCEGRPRRNYRRVDSSWFAGGSHSFVDLLQLSASKA